MTDDVIEQLAKTRDLMSKEDFVTWIASRNGAGAKIDIEAAELGRRPT